MDARRPPTMRFEKENSEYVVVGDLLLSGNLEFIDNSGCFVNPPTPPRGPSTGRRAVRRPFHGPSTASPRSVPARHAEEHPSPDETDEEAATCAVGPFKYEAADPNLKAPPSSSVPHYDCIDDKSFAFNLNLSLNLVAKKPAVSRGCRDDRLCA